MVDFVQGLRSPSFIGEVDSSSYHALGAFVDNFVREFYYRMNIIVQCFLSGACFGSKEDLPQILKV